MRHVGLDTGGRETAATRRFSWQRTSPGAKDRPRARTVLVSTARVPLRQDILAARRHTKPLLDSFGVAHVSLFGSFARDEAREDSDVDLFVEFNRPIGMFEFVRLQRELSERIGRKVELVTRAALKPQLRDRILAEAVLAA